MLVGLLVADDSGKIKYFKQEDVGREKACLSLVSVSNYGTESFQT